MSKLRFLAVFLIAFALLLAAWNRIDGGAWHRRAVLGIAAATGPAVHGWLLQPATTPGTNPYWVRDNVRVDLRIQFDALAVGLVPLWALFVATPNMRPRRRLRGLLLGSLGCLLIDAAIVVWFPLLVHHENAFTDIGGTFLGLIGFVGAPVILWFAFSWSELRPWLPSLREARESTLQTSRLQP